MVVDGRRLGAVPLPDVDAALREAERCLDTLHMQGLTFGCSIGDYSPEDERFHPFWAELDRRYTVVLLHPVHRYVELYAALVRRSPRRRRPAPPPV